MMWFYLLGIIFLSGTVINATLQDINHERIYRKIPTFNSWKLSKRKKPLILIQRFNYRFLNLLINSAENLSRFSISSSSGAKFIFKLLAPCLAPVLLS